MNALARRLPALVLAVLAAPLSAMAADLSCPAELQADETPRGDTPAGWHLAQQLRVSARRLEGIDLYAGHPDQMAALVPDASVRKGMQRVSTWRFDLSGKETYWVACTYSNSLLQWVRPLAAGTQQCVLTQRVNKAGNAVAIESLDCR